MLNLMKLDFSWQDRLAKCNCLRCGQPVPAGEMMWFLLPLPRRLRRGFEWFGANVLTNNGQMPVAVPKGARRTLTCKGCKAELVATQASRRTFVLSLFAMLFGLSALANECFALLPPLPMSLDLLVGFLLMLPFLVLLNLLLALLIRWTVRIRVLT